MFCFERSNSADEEEDVASFGRNASGNPINIPFDEDTDEVEELGKYSEFVI